MSRLDEFVPDADVLLAMEPEQLGWYLLHSMNQRPVNQRSMTLGRWMNEFSMGPGLHSTLNTITPHFALWPKHGLGWRCSSYGGSLQSVSERSVITKRILAYADIHKSMALVPGRRL